jgi:hypothetical protein
MKDRIWRPAILWLCLVLNSAGAIVNSMIGSWDIVVVNCIGMFISALALTVVAWVGDQTRE